MTDVEFGFLTACTFGLCRGCRHVVILTAKNKLIYDEGYLLDLFVGHVLKTRINLLFTQSHCSEIAHRCNLIV
jgi:hypothetical protein